MHYDGVLVENLIPRLKQRAFKNDVDALLSLIKPTDSFSMSYIDKEDKIIAIDYGEFSFIFNFNPTQSFVDYKVACRDSKKLRLVLNTDNRDYEGLSHDADVQLYFPDAQDNHISVTMQPHSALILKRL